MIKFKASLFKLDEWTILQLRDSASEKLPSRGQAAIVGKINGYDLQEVLEPNG